MLRSTLAALECATDVGVLFRELGYHPLQHPFGDDAMLIARWKSFKIIVAEAPEPQRRSHALARHLATLSIRGLAVAVGPAGEIALTAPRMGQAGTTRSLVVQCVRPTPFALEQLERLRPDPGSTALSHALRVAEVLQSEVVGERFFTAFRLTVARMAATLGTRGASSDRRFVALLALTRVLFLYFVQSKGWLDGQPDYLRRLLDRTLRHGRHFHRSALHPLFFGTLNRPPGRRSRRPALGAIPYLNGGLFEPHPLERRLGPAFFANELWRDAFDDVFERFRFCVRETDDLDAIAPDMLGRVFERLMDGRDRHDTGTFYTPATVVRQIVDATLETALLNVLTPQAARRLVAREPLDGRDRASARRAVNDLRILDPAVGSGAFLLGTLDAIYRLRIDLEPRHRTSDAGALKRAILRANLFGVDVNPVAVRLAELRLWLAVIADDPIDRIDAVTPLPNLDGVVRQGDTLLDPLGAARRFGAEIAPTAVSATVTAARRRMFDARGNAQRTTLQALRTAETELARQLLTQVYQSASHAMKDLVAAARSRDLFGRRRGMTVSEHAGYRKWRRVRRDAQRAARKLETGTVPFFAFEVHAPDVLASGGFSAVVGNPPWVRAEALPAELRSALKDRFGWWQSASDRGFAHQPDLAVAFLERCVELVQPGGAVGLLVPSKLATAGYGETARRQLVRDTSISYVHRVPDSDASRFGATTYPLALVLRKAVPSPRHAVQLDFNRSACVKQATLDTPGPWILLPNAERSAIDAFLASGEPLGGGTYPVLGIKTGADRVFVGTLLRQAGGVAVVRIHGEAIDLETEILRPVLRGRDVRPFEVTPTRVLLWGHDASGSPLRQLPPRAEAHIRRHAQCLRGRSDYRRGPLWTVFRTRAAALPHAVVWSDLARRPTAVTLGETRSPDAIPLNTCYVTEAASREAALVLSAVMNSVWAAAFARACADEARGGYRRINARFVARIPCPPPCADVATLSAEAHAANTGFSSPDLDEAVADALNLPGSARDTLRALAADHRGTARRRSRPV